MKNYFTGFITATCLTASLFLLMGSQNIKTQTEPIIITSEKGTTKIGGVLLRSIAQVERKYLMLMWVIVIMES